MLKGSKTERRRGDLFVLLAAVIWGVAFYFQKTAMTHIGPLLFIGLRGSLAALALLPLAFIEQKNSKQPLKDLIPIAFLGGAMFFIAGSIQQYGLISATVTNTGFLTAIYVVFTPFFYWLIKRQRPTRVTWIAVVLAFVGVLGLSGGSLTGLSEGDFLVSLSSVFWALLLITTGESSKWKRPLTYTCMQFAVVGLLGLVFAHVFETIEIQAIKQSVVSIVYVGLLSTAFTFALMALALKHMPAPRASVLLSTETLFAAAAGYILLGERLSLIGWVGAILILMAVLVLTKERSLS
ncbi:MAG: drug/metabolite transporter (DMT)-like permease [Granulosicoccus sp.]|jgi:drug/metabolite transporter (DMT)-like permease